MRLKFLLPKIEVDHFLEPQVCPRAKCGGTYLRCRQEVAKPVRDTQYRVVTARRYECLRCHHTFRVYPRGVERAHTSQRVQGLAVMFYVLGLSYGAVALALEALGPYLSKTQVYEVVQKVAAKVPGLKRTQVFEGVRTPAVGGDLTSVRCRGQWLGLGLTVDATGGWVLSVDEVDGLDAATLQAWLAPIVEAAGAELLVTDDADALKTVADELGLAHQVCKAHVGRNTDALVTELLPLVRSDADGSLTAHGLAADQAVTDLERLHTLIHTRPVAAQAELAALSQRYQVARPPQPGATFSLAYRLRLLFLDRWNLWPRLTRYRTWHGPAGETVDGTNNGCERAIGWWIKERYRAMRGYKRPLSAINLSRFMAWCGNYLGRGGANLQTLFA